MPSYLNLGSDKIKVFPSTRRSYDKQSNSRFLSELNITNITNKLVSKKNFMITRSFSSVNDPVEFVIQGYYFKINSLLSILDLFESVSGDKSKIYAYINLDAFNNLVELAGEDLDNIYNGLTLTETKPTGENFLLLILKVSSTGSLSLDNIQVPEESMEMFDNYSLNIDINGGDLDLIYP